MTSSTSRTAWNYSPELPLEFAPILVRPVRLAPLAAHMIRAWRPWSVRFWMLMIAVATWHFATPSLTTTEHLAVGWIGFLLIRNLVFTLVATGGLHLWLYRFRRQGDLTRYDARPLGRNKRIFLFNDQVKDNMFLTMASAVPIWTAVEAAMLWAYANGAAPSISWSGDTVWFIVLIALVPAWSSFYFSVTHWLLHRGPMYRHVHSWHHKNVNLGPWSGLAMHPVEHGVLFADALLFLVLPAHPVHFLFALAHHAIGAAYSHTGYHVLKGPGGRSFAFGDFFHHLHHRFVDSNYGALNTPLDLTLDSFHDGTPDGERHHAERRKKLAAKRRRASEMV